MALIVEGTRPVSTTQYHLPDDQGKDPKTVTPTDNGSNVPTTTTATATTAATGPGVSNWTPVALQVPPNSPDPKTAGDETKRKIDQALAADKAVTDLEKSLGKNAAGNKDLATRRTFADQKWKEVQASADYELRLTASDSKDVNKTLTERRAPMLAYAPGNERFQKIVDGSIKRVANQNPAERATDIQHHEMKQAEAGLKTELEGPHRNGGRIQEARESLQRERAEFNEALRLEMDARFKTLGPAVNNIPDPYKYVTQSMSQRFSDPAIKNQIEALSIGRQVAEAKDLPPQEQIQKLDQLLRGKSQEIRTLVYNDPRTANLLGGAVKRAYETEGAPAAAKLLREMATIAGSPETAAALLRASMPTVQAIVQDMSTFVEDRAYQRGIKNPFSPAAYETILGDLSKTLGEVAPFEDPAAAKANQPLVDEVAGLFVQGYDGKRTDFGATFGRGIRQAVIEGGGVTLAANVVKQLKEQGRTSEAESIAGHVNSGLNDFKYQIQEAWGRWTKAHGQEQFMQAGFGWQANPNDPKQTADLKAFWDQYYKDHPDIATTEIERQNFARSAARTLGEIKLYGGHFKGTPSGDRLPGMAKEMFEQEATLNMVNGDQEVQEMLALDMQNNGAHSIVAQMSPWNLPVAARGLAFRVSMVYLGNRLTAAQAAVARGDAAALRTELNALKGKARLLGFSADRIDTFNRMLTMFDDAGMAAIKGDKTRLKVALEQFSALSQEKFRPAGEGQRNGPAYHPSTLSGVVMRAAGIIFLAPISAAQNFGPNSAWANDPLAPEHLGSTAQTIFFDLFMGQQMSFLGGGAAQSLALKTGHPGLAIKAGEFTNAIGHWSEPLSLASAVVEVALAGSYLIQDDPNIPLAALHAGNAVGNGLLASGYMKGGTSPTWNKVGGLWGRNAVPFPRLIAVGTVVTLVAQLGLFAYGQWIQPIQEKAKFENEDMTKFLQALGYSEPVAHQLRNQDGDQGASAGPVLRELAIRLGVDVEKPDEVQKFGKWVESLGKDKVADLISHAHMLNPNDKGEYQATAGNDKYLALSVNPANAKTRPATTTFNSTTGRYEDSATGMYFDDKTRVWRTIAAGNPGDSKEVRVYNPDSERFTLRGGGGRAGPATKEVNVESLDGLRNWAIAQGWDGIPS